MSTTAAVAGLTTLLSGDVEWRNIQLIIKTTLDAVVKVLSSHAVLLETMDSRLDRLQEAYLSTNKNESMGVSRQEFGELQMEIHKYHKKSVSINDLDARIASAMEQIKRRVDHTTMPLKDALNDLQENLTKQVIDRVQEVFVTKDEFDTFRQSLKDNMTYTAKEVVAKSIAGLEKKITSSTELNTKDRIRKSQLRDLLQFKSSIEEEVHSLAKRIPEIIHAQAAWQTDVKKEMLRQKAHIDESLSKLATDCQAQLRQKAMASDVQLVLSSKADRGEWEKSHRQDIELLEARLAEQHEAMNRAVSLLKVEFGRILERKCSKSDVVKIFARKVNLEDVQAWLAEKVNHSELRDICTELLDTANRQVSEFQTEIHEELQCFEKNVDTRINEARGQLSESMHALQNQFHTISGWKVLLEEMQSQMITKMGIKDTCTLLDTKCNITDVNEALSNIQQNIATKTDEVDYKALVDDLSSLRQQMRGELCLGRWIWKHGRPTEQQTIQWNIQILNTSPDIFHWEKGSDSIALELPGLYQLQACFFTDYNPTIQVVVNGEPALTAHSGEAKRVRHSAGNVTGISICEFLALPPHATITFSYSIDERAQACFTLRKL
ncbi:hypothetical protein THRCLA_03033 [Thraustotheca clavata]|uniref:Uncharacterized protein n=1 Tax=Thraustotheca clavata TaxID=74557 RepID=A0A1W0A3X5_9STRA|nr:hypothetical protein THRCLA_03033 [Thraustotheca clavata]